jgi:hypothetical protein
MKKILIIAVFLFSSSSIFAQVEITGFGGWLWTGSIPAWLQDIKVSDEANYGIAGGVRIREEMLVEFEWNHTENQAEFREYQVSGGLGDPVVVPLTMNYYMLGFNYLATFNEPIVPYGLINIDMLNSKATGAQPYNTSNNYFTVGFGGGLRYYLSDKIGIKLQARLLLPMQFGGVGFGCGIGTGGGNCGAGVSTYTNIIQGDFTGGIILKLGGS